MDFEELIKNLEPGSALVSHRWIMARKRDGQLVGGRDGCDEPATYQFSSPEAAFETLERWLRAPSMKPDFEQRVIPHDVEETHWMFCTLEHRPF